MSTLEEHLKQSMQDCSTDLVLSPGTARRAWDKGRRRHRRAQVLGCALTATAIGVTGLALQAIPSGSSRSSAIPASSPNTLVVTPTSGPSVGPSPDPSGPASSDLAPDPALAAVHLPDPAPGFPLRRHRDLGNGVFLLGVRPPHVEGNSFTPTDHEATVLVTRALGQPAPYPDPVIGTVTVRGVTGKVVRSDAHQIGVQATVDGYLLQAYGDNSVAGTPVTPEQLVALLDALTGI